MSGVVTALADMFDSCLPLSLTKDDLSQLDGVRMSGLDATGFTTDIVSCDETSCVCVQERLEWPLGLCHNSSDVINALKYLSSACGLPTDF